MRVWWDRRLKWMRASTIAIVSILIILLFFAGFTIYGNKVGNFVINVGVNSDISLALSSHEDLSDQRPRLIYGALTELKDATYDWLPKNIPARGFGNISDNEQHTFMAFSFYLINNSSRSVDCDVVMSLVGTVGEPMGMLRIMMIEEEEDTFSGGNRIYAMEETSPERKAALDADLEHYRPYDVDGYFLIDEGDKSGKLFSFQLKDFDAGAHIRYTVVMWLEGCDLDTVNEHIGTRAKLQLDITGY